MTKTNLIQPIYSLEGKKTGDVTLPENIFNKEPKPKTISQSLASRQKNTRPSIAHSKDRSEVRGGGRKPWRQKGTGRARHGSIRSPIWRGGGVTHGPRKEKKYSAKINRRVKNSVLSMALSGKLKDKEIIFVDNITVKNSKTKELSLTLSSLMKDKKSAKTMLVLSSVNDNIKRASSNLNNIKVTEARNIDFFDVLSVKYLIVTKEALDQIIKRLS